MKKFLILILVVSFTIMGKANSSIHNGSITVSGEILASSEYCIIVKSVDDKGNPLFWVFSQIVNTFLPDVANFVCLKIVGENNQQICDAIYDGINFVSSISSIGKLLKKMLSNSIEMVAERGGLKSFFSFSASTLELALNVKSTLEAYKKLGIVNWESIGRSNNIIEDYNSKIGEVRIENVTSETFYLQLSNDGITWTTKRLMPGEFFDYNFWEYGILKKNYGFVKGSNLCNHQIFTGKGYKIRYNYLDKEFYIIAK